jgi:5-methylcytosine-specific restriction endonuclease McrA
MLQKVQNIGEIIVMEFTKISIQRGGKMTEVKIPRSLAGILTPQSSTLRTRNDKNIPREVKESVLQRAEGKCECCNRKVATRSWTIHHIVYRSAGGKNSEDNLAMVCNNCHTIIHKNIRSQIGFG